MKVSAVFVCLAAILSTGVADAAPLRQRSLVYARNNKVKMMNGQKANSSSSSAKGAVYFMTNDPKENFIIAADIGSDGKLTLNRAVSSRGRGSHGQTSPNGPDALFSQGSVKASANGKILATVNPGSNTVSVYSINENNPSEISLIGDPVSSEGEFPMSLAINSNGTQVCVLNGGAVNGVNCYKVDKDVGLTAVPNTLRSLGINQTTPATGPAGTASHVIFSEDGKSLIASIKGTPPTPGFLAVWDVNSDGSLSQDFKKVAPASGGLLPFSMTVIPGKNAILATDAGLGFDVFDFSSGNKSSAVPIQGQSATCWSSFSKKTGNFYLTDIGTATVTEVNVDDNLKGSIVKQYPQKAGSATIDNDIASIGNNDFLYVLAPNATQIDVLSLDGAGQAKSIQTLDIAGPAKAAGLSIDPFNLQGMTSFVKRG